MRAWTETLLLLINQDILKINAQTDWIQSMFNTYFTDSNSFNIASFDLF